MLRSANAAQAAIFDKDGTLLDFAATWNPAVGETLEVLTGQRRADPLDRSTELRHAADALGYDLESGTIRAGSLLIAESNDVLIALLEPIIGRLTATVLDTDAPFGDLFNRCGLEAVLKHTTAAAGAARLLALLHDRGIPMAIATNDSEVAARQQMETLEWSRFFDSIVGYDSGFGSKPDPGMVAASARALGIAPEHCLMVGDSSHDIDAGRSAGTMTALITDAQTAPDPGAPGPHVAVENLDGLYDLFS